jgi:hypothetical protein
VTDEGCFYLFNFSGPNAKLQAELTGECKTFEEFIGSKQMKKFEDMLTRLGQSHALEESQLQEIQNKLASATKSE